MKRWSLGILLVMAVVWIWAAKKDERAGVEPEEIIPVEQLVLPEEKKTEKKRIALTFDDGPHPIYTPQMLELLKEEQVPATFFLLGENVELYGDVVKEIAKEGHLIGNHTYHHVQITSLSLEEACKEIQETSDLIEELTGTGTEYVRPPFGTWNEELEERLNLIPVMWSIDTKDWTTQNVDWIVRETVKHAEDHDIILMHDSYQSTVDAVKRVIEQLEAEGFEFVTVDEIIMD
ncbi:polysaccharide deacetylase family protein [Clostridiaceae bacterium Marseille-Q4145]|nr:polysaccharide deacetylase family protein [Clostridiaceae bacterium Marseille-Q4145]